MRLPLTPDISTKDGTSASNARVYNALAEKKPTGQILATVRPAITSYAATGTAAVGQGGSCYSGTFCTVFGGKLYNPSASSVGAAKSIPNASASLMFDFVQGSYVAPAAPNFWSWGWTPQNYFYMNSTPTQPYT